MFLFDFIARGKWRPCMEVGFTICSGLTKISTTSIWRRNKRVPNIQYRYVSKYQTTFKKKAERIRQHNTKWYNSMYWSPYDSIYYIPLHLITDNGTFIDISSILFITTSKILIWHNHQQFRECDKKKWAKCYSDQTTVCTSGFVNVISCRLNLWFCIH